MVKFKKSGRNIHLHKGTENYKLTFLKLILTTATHNFKRVKFTYVYFDLKHNYASLVNLLIFLD